jgi:hypothetical protein
MKKILFILSVIFLISSCCKQTKSDIKTTKTHIFYKNYIPEHVEYGYHYGYDVFKCKYCYHYGEHTINEIYIVQYIIENDTITNYDKTLYDIDTINIDYTKVYCDTVFSHIEINKIY